MPVPSKVPFLRRRRKEQQKIADDDVGEQIPRDVFPSDGPKVEGRCNDIVTRELAEEKKKKKKTKKSRRVDPRLRFPLLAALSLVYEGPTSLGW